MTWSIATKDCGLPGIDAMVWPLLPFDAFNASPSRLSVSWLLASDLESSSAMSPPMCSSFRDWLVMLSPSEPKALMSDLSLRLCALNNLELVKFKKFVVSFLKLRLCFPRYNWSLTLLSVNKGGGIIAPCCTPTELLLESELCRTWVHALRCTSCTELSGWSFEMLTGLFDCFHCWCSTSPVSSEKCVALTTIFGAKNGRSLTTDVRGPFRPESVHRHDKLNWFRKSAGGWFRMRSFIHFRHELSIRVQRGNISCQRVLSLFMNRIKEWDQTSK